VHVGGFSGTHFGAGWPTYFVEHHTSFTQAYVTQVVSLVSSGVFERFPRLRVVFEEGGIGWMPSLMWRLDHSWEAMREHVPHLTEPPSSVIRRHMAFTTQPLDEPEQARFLVDVLDQLDMDDRIMFASDYPHWDFDDPERVLPASLIGAERRKRILSENALSFFDFA
jgi:predicted TIM-barrel fold metal-dependent hydrolase